MENIKVGFMVGAAVGASLLMYNAIKRWEEDETETHRNIHGRLPVFEQSTPICLICNEAIFSNNSTIEFPCCHRFHYFCVEFTGVINKCVICLHYKNKSNQRLSSYNHNMQMSPNPNIHPNIKSDQINTCQASSSRQQIGKENQRKLDVIYCIICNKILRDVNSERTFSCNHAFHKRCIKSVFKQNENEKCIICHEGPIKEVHRRHHVDLQKTPTLCTICNSLVHDRAKFFRCGHVFHNRCLRFLFGADCIWTCFTCPERVPNEQQTRRKDGATNEDEKDVCVICMDVLSKTRRRILTCGHSFHNACIEKWSAKSKVCPFRCNAKN